jgi:hypothetical protein
VELLAVLIGTRVGVGVVVHYLERPLGVLELHLLLLVTLGGNFLLALPPLGRSGITTWLLLLLLAELFHELHDLPALLSTMVHGVVYQAL